MSFSATDSKGNPKIAKPTVQELDNAVIKDPAIQNLRKRHIRIEKEYKYIDSLYWAVKSKDDKLNKITQHLIPKDFEEEIIEGVINGVMIKKAKALIKKSKVD